jgi:t-SNARE complex subunit (syntaxin)
MQQRRKQRLMPLPRWRAIGSTTRSSSCTRRAKAPTPQTNSVVAIARVVRVVVEVVVVVVVILIVLVVVVVVLVVVVVAKAP